DVTRAQESLVADYVRRGGAFLYAGGASGYGPGGWQGSALEELLPLRMAAEQDRETPGVAISLAIARSGSMSGLPLAMAKEACTATLGVLEPGDLLEVIAFDSRPTRFVKMQPARYRRRIQSAILSIRSGGGTNLFRALDLAYQDLAAIEARRKHIILLTDGNAGSDGLYDIAEAAFSEGITVTAVGLGEGVNRRLLEMIAEAGGGRYHAARDPSSLPRIFTRETQMIARKQESQDWQSVQLVRRPGFLKGVPLQRAPYLRGFTKTQLKGRRSELILSTEEGDPLFARWRYGQGWALAWTSDWKNGWAKDWLQWPAVGQFWGQVIRGNFEKEKEETRPISVERFGSTVVIAFEALDRRGFFQNDFASDLKLRSRSSQNVEGKVLPFELIEPGRYEVRTELPGLGAYSVEVSHQRSGQFAGRSAGTVSWPYPDEYLQLKADFESLKEWAELGEGWIIEKDSAWKAPTRPLVRFQPRQALFFAISLVLLLVDVLLRRIRWSSRSDTELVF
ncbi:MAG: VWA domain-containing protein, partial [Polyangiaceae bacterium]|nr:VWA domain-containing protein [Polyangiaceae bacterium]